MLAKGGHTGGHRPRENGKSGMVDKDRRPRNMPSRKAGKYGKLG